MATLNVSKALGNAKTRTFVLFFAVIFIIAIGIILTKTTGQKDALSGPATTKTAEVPQDIRAVPGNQTPEKYRELQLKDNEERIDAAKKSNHSAIPTIVHTDIVKGTSGGFGLVGNEIIHGKGPYGPYGLEMDGQQAFGIGPDGKSYDTHGWHTLCYGANGPIGLGPKGQPFGIDREGKPFDGKDRPCDDKTNALGVQIHGYSEYGPYGVGPNGPFGLGPDGKAYDLKGPFVPSWYHPTAPSAAEQTAARLKDQTAHIEALRKERAIKQAEEQARQEASRQAASSEKVVQQQSTAMDQLVKALFTSWSHVATQSYTAAKRTDDAPSTGGSNRKNLNSSTDNSSTTKSSKERIVQAGDILFAVIDTAINSDEPGPIMATVVSGDFKGARLLGQFAAPTGNAEALTLTFTQLNWNKLERSIGINAVAIDPDTARTALASEVDHHYLMRYGSLFASSFMQGYGQAITGQGSTSVSNGGTTTSTTQKLSPKQELYAAVGQVGTQWSQQAAPLFQTPATIKINSGVGVGVLFLADVGINGIDVPAATPAPTATAAPVAATVKNIDKSANTTTSNGGSNSKSS